MPNLASLRADTDLSPGLIHLNHAGGSLPPRVVTQAILDYLLEESRRGAYETAAAYGPERQAFYEQAARYLHCRPANVALASNATDAFSRGLSSIPWRAGDRVLTTQSDYVSNHLAFLQLRQRFGVQLELLPEGAAGYDPAALETRLRQGPPPRLLSITHVATNKGLIQDVYTAGKLLRYHAGDATLYSIDACQSAGQLPLDSRELHCDFLSTSFRKFLRGPRGVGLLYVSDRVLATELAPLGLDLQGGQVAGSSAV
ncbi:MAG: aminotransferase class V-fold PLP-dependent enzyme [Lewinella sp.]|nr:aminotransferase class V-fold PLP-dependent enzyme [Lewinella sp.]